MATTGMDFTKKWESLIGGFNFASGKWETAELKKKRVDPYNSLTDTTLGENNQVPYPEIHDPLDLSKISSIKSLDLGPVWSGVTSNNEQPNPIVPTIANINTPNLSPYLNDNAKSYFKELTDLLDSEVRTNIEKQGKLEKGAGIAGAAGDLLNSFLPEKREYSGQKGAITAGLDSAYDQLADAASKFGPVGSMIGGIMKGSAALGKVTNMIGGGTSGMTTKDAILGSNFLNMTPLGLVNGFGGRTTSTITKDNEAFAQVGPSYGGTENTVDEALEVSGKKYGLLSNSERKKAERQLAEARRLQSIIQGISDDALIRNILQGTMSDILSNRYGLLLQGGYNLSAIHVGKRGLKVSPYKARRLTSNVTFKFLPKEVKKDKQGTVIEPTDLNLIITTFKEGGSVPTKVGTVLKPSKIETIIEPVLIITEIAPLELDLIQTFLNGGEINIIPDGALHKNLHHMEDAEHLTKKGIPVVAIDNDELVAEIEKNEIILRKSVTEKLEELCKLYYSEDITKKEKDEYALEAGLMLVDEILNNTIDNTNELL